MADAPLPLSFLHLGTLSSAKLVKALFLLSLKGSEIYKVLQSFTTKWERTNVVLSAL